MKTRLDKYLVESNAVTGRDRAKELIVKGRVQVDGHIITKPSHLVDYQNKIEILGELLPYVSRGGLKLEKALDIFKIDLNDKVCMDIGASTGGFTDCMLAYGAKLVYAIDVGSNQLVDSLRNRDDVVVMENTNIRYFDTALLAHNIDFIGTDVSFISLAHVFPVASNILINNGEAVCLVKPQFEAGPENVGKNGIVRDKSVHIDVLNNITASAAQNDFSVLGIEHSPIQGQKGNIEYLFYLKKDLDRSVVSQQIINNVVESSFNSF